MEAAEERSIEGAVDVYLERLDRLRALGLDLESARSGAMLVALVWLGAEKRRAEFEGKIQAALARRPTRLGRKRPLPRVTGENGRRALLVV